MTELARFAAGVEAVAIAILVIAVIGSVVVRTTRARVLRPRLAAAAEALHAAALGRDTSESAARAVRRLPRRDRLEILHAIALELAGEGRARVAEVAERLGVTAWADRACGDRRWWHRLHAVRLLAALGRGAGVVPALLSDGHPLVRAEAAYWVGETGHSASASALAGILAREEGLPLFAAQDALIRLGPAGAAAVLIELERIAQPSRQLMRVVAAMPDPAGIGAILRLATDAGYAHRDLAVAALAGMPGAETGRALEAALDDQRAAVRAAAAAGIGQRHDPASAPRLAQAVTDPSWEVRRAAALALHGLGAAGTLYLRQLRAGPDRYAAEMARHVIEFDAARA